MSLPLAIFIHGFRGSETTFLDFPSDLVAYLTSHFGISIDTAPFSYDSTKPAKQAIDQLKTSLVKEAASDIRPFVILIAHPIGGLIILDALNELKDLVSYEKSTPGLVNIGGIITLDSPFYGVKHEIIADFGIQTMANQVERVVPGISRTGWGLLGATVLAVGGLAYTSSTRIRSRVDSLLVGMLFLT